MTTILTHDTLCALQIAYDGTEAQEDVRLLIGAYQELQRQLAERDKMIAGLQKSRDMWFDTAHAQAIIGGSMREALEGLDAHMDFSTTIDGGVCTTCGNGWENADGINEAMENARTILAKVNGEILDEADRHYIVKQFGGRDA